MTCKSLFGWTNFLLIILTGTRAIEGETECHRSMKQYSLSGASFCYNTSGTGNRVVLDVFDAHHSSVTNCRCTITTTHSTKVSFAALNSLQPGRQYCQSSIFVGTSTGSGFSMNCFVSGSLNINSIETISISFEKPPYSYDAKYCIILSSDNADATLTLKCVGDIPGSPATTSTTTRTATMTSSMTTTTTTSRTTTRPRTTGTTTTQRTTTTTTPMTKTSITPPRTTTTIRPMTSTMTTTRTTTTTSPMTTTTTISRTTTTTITTTPRETTSTPLTTTFTNSPRLTTTIRPMTAAMTTATTTTTMTKSMTNITPRPKINTTTEMTAPIKTSISTNLYIYILTPLTVLFAILTLVFLVIACRKSRRQSENYSNVIGRTEPGEYETISRSSASAPNISMGEYETITDVTRNLELRGDDIKPTKYM